MRAFYYIYICVQLVVSPCLSPLLSFITHSQKIFNCRLQNMDGLLFLIAWPRRSFAHARSSLEKNRVTSHARNKNEKKYPWLNEETGLKKEFKSCF
jgi:hypothetical protein